MACSTTGCWGCPALQDQSRSSRYVYGKPAPQLQLKCNLLIPPRPLEQPSLSMATLVHAQLSASLGGTSTSTLSGTSSPSMSNICHMGTCRRTVPLLAACTLIKAAAVRRSLLSRQRLTCSATPRPGRCTMHWQQTCASGREQQLLTARCAGLGD
jgi:hypothetical protein